MTRAATAIAESYNPFRADLLRRLRVVALGLWLAALGLAYHAVHDDPSPRPQVTERAQP